LTDTTAISSTPLARMASRFSMIAGQMVEMAGGRKRAWHREHHTTFLPAKRSLTLVSAMPSAVFSLKVASGSLSPIAIVTSALPFVPLMSFAI
jgi:hypothetical protein